MCELCDKETRSFRQEGLRREAGRLRSFAQYLDGLASGGQKPHDDKTLPRIRTEAAALVRILADWLP